MKITQGMVPGMAWLAGSGPKGTRCLGCRHAALDGHGVDVTCLLSRPVNGRRVRFQGTEPSCRRFAVNLGWGDLGRGRS
ncbi:hypothetical protein [Azospirillum sp. A39]|uniref:hypothetical protein n=1 Tax=Azospirillum sp. A39 TaxID=3462279 RepID=UPI004045345F